MTASGFDREAAYSVFEALRPRTDETLDRGAFATYSLDLVAVAALILSLSRAGEQELEAGPLSFVDALNEVAPRIDIVFQKDRLKPAARHFGVLHMLDRRIHAIQPPRGASYHPKLALVRYLGPKHRVTWRLWLGSRNLTGGQDREAGLLLVGRAGNTRGSRSPGIASSIASMAADMLPDLGWIADFRHELESVRWNAPKDVRLKNIQWRRAGEYKKFATTLRGATHTVAISPFVDDAGCSAFDGCAQNSLLTTSDAAINLKIRSDLMLMVDRSPTFDVPIAVEASESSTSIDEISQVDPAGIHAKLLLRQKGNTTRLWIGSANLTRRGMDGPNAEVLAELEISPDLSRPLISYVEDAARLDLKDTELGPDMEQKRAAERKLDDAITTILGAGLEIGRSSEGLTLTSEISFDNFLSEHSLQAWLLTRPDSVTSWETGQRTVLLVPGGIPLKLETVLVCFSAERLQNDCPPRTWAQSVSFPEHDADARDRAATAAYIGIAGASAWVRAQLEGIVGAEGTTWTGHRRWAGSGFAGSGDALPLAIEEVLAAWARNPKEFETRAELLEDTLKALSAELAQAPEDEQDAAAISQWSQVEQLWTAIRTAIGEAK
jgi:hypothetical protein